MGTTRRRIHPLDRHEPSLAAATATATTTTEGTAVTTSARRIPASMTVPTRIVTDLNAAVYVLSGVCQPLIMTLCKDAGLADASAQLYMVWYYVGPALLILTTLRETWSSTRTVTKACGIAFFDITAQSLNYTGASLAGPTLFAIVYSSVTVWTAVWSRFVLQRRLSWEQWAAVLLVFGGLALTATDSLNLGPRVTHGTFLVLIGSALHAGSYVWSEAVMSGTDGLSVRQNSGVQGLVALVALIGWQFVYTAPRWQALISDPMQVAHTTWMYASIIMGSFAVANLAHSYCFYHTIRYFKGGSVSAGVMKGLQAVLVFLASHEAYCGRTGGEEMCFTTTKAVSLATVVGGVLLFSWATGRHEPSPSKEGYARVDSTVTTGDDSV
jgi:drug/metabolite transporter (DMT)-like permease